MSTHKHIDRICCIVILAVLMLIILFMNGELLGISAVKNELRYESRLFNISSVNTIDIVMDDWEAFIVGYEDEEYESCSIIIDDELYKNVAIRAKGNT